MTSSVPHHPGRIRTRPPPLVGAGILDSPAHQPSLHRPPRANPQPALTAVILSEPKASRRIFPFPPARRLFRCVTPRPYRRDGYQPSARDFLRPAPPRANPHPCTCLSPRRGEVSRSEVEGPLDPRYHPSQSLRDSSPLPCGGASQVGFPFSPPPSFLLSSPFSLPSSFFSQNGLIAKYQNSAKTLVMT